MGAVSAVVLHSRLQALNFFVTKREESISAIIPLRDLDPGFQIVRTEFSALCFSMGCGLSKLGNKKELKSASRALLVIIWGQYAVE